RRRTNIFRYFSRVKFLIVRYWHLLVIGVAALIATDLMGAAIPWLIKGGIDTALSKGKSTWDLLKYPLLILGAALLQGMFRYFWRMNIFGFSRRVEWDLRSTVFSHLLKVPLSYFQHTKTGDLMSRLTNDMQAIRELLGFGSLAVIDAAVVITASLSFMIAIDPWLTLWSLLAMPLISLSVRFFGSRIFHWSRDVQQHLSKLSTYVQEDLAGIRVVQAYAQEENQFQGFHRLSSEYLRKNLWLATLWGILWPLMRVFSGIAAAIVLWVGGRKVLQGTMTLGEFTAFNGYLAMLTWPVMAVGHVVNQYQRGTAALSRIIEVLDTPVAPGYRQEDLPAPARPIQGHIELRSLSFSYGDQHFPALKEISLAIPAGSTCGIIGETGSGKTTLVHLLLRLFEPPPGTIFIDRIDITEIPLATLKEGVGFVSQDIFLFSDTIRENILFGHRDADIEALEEAAGIAQILPSIREFTHQFDTVLGERGVRLSGGQKQRTALARAIIKSPPILILDDAFSSVDTETEEEILNHLRQFMEKRTTLLISHRISTVQGADLIVYLRDGEIIERGTHEELLARQGAYYRLYQKQQLAREVEEMAREEESG
ncbi:MAG: ABC transporter ATP-binding protein, partial [Candidatus Tectomicrobia bacterium]|nr:ABC transporter ATP-binding protein [Candidatus Tectomicrobia bacterium]